MLEGLRGMGGFGQKKSLADARPLGGLWGYGLFVSGQYVYGFVGSYAWHSEV